MFLHPTIIVIIHVIAFCVVNIHFIFKIFFKNICNAKMVEKNMAAKKPKEYIPLQILIAKYTILVKKLCLPKLILTCAKYVSS